MKNGVLYPANSLVPRTLAPNQTIERNCDADVLKFL